MRPRVSRGKLAGVPASKKHLFDSVGPKSEHLKLFSLLGFGDFSKFLEWCLPGGQLTPTPCKSILLAVKPSQVPYNANIYIYIYSFVVLGMGLRRVLVRRVPCVSQ
jgi:hypothetical protein